MSIDDFRAGFKYFTITYMHRDYQSSFLEKRDAVSRRLYKFNFTIYDEPVRTERHPSDISNVMFNEKLAGKSSILSKLSKDLDNMPLFTEFDKDDIDMELLQIDSTINLGDDDGEEAGEEPENTDEDDDSSGVSDVDSKGTSAEAEK